MSKRQLFDVYAQSKPQKRARRAIDKNDSADEMDSDDLDGDLDLSDEEESGALNRAQIKKAKRNFDPQLQREESKERFQVEYDTNIFQVKLGCLENQQ